MLSPNLDGIPAEIRSLPHWCTWLAIECEGKDKPDKVPHRVDDDPRHPTFSSTAPNTWATHEQALRALDRGFWTGIGYVFAPDDPFCGVDLDHCRDPDTGEIDPWARSILDSLDSYTEVSPSGTGVKVWVRATKPGAEWCKRGKSKLPTNWEGLAADAELEMYDRARYFAVTGLRLVEYPATIEERHGETAALYFEVLAAQRRRDDHDPPAPSKPVDLEDAELLERARSASNGAAFDALWNGATSAHDDDHSRADLALVSMLMFWTGNDSARTDRLFRLSGLMRDKWANREDYRGWTLDKARQSEVYRLGGSHPGAAEGRAGDRHSPDRRGFGSARTDAGNAARLIARHGENLRYCTARGWLVWDGRRWIDDERLRVVEFAKESARSILDEARDHLSQPGIDPDTAKKDADALAKWWSASESRSRIDAAVSLARSIPSVAVSVADLDTDPWLLNCSNCTLDLRTGKARPHSRDDLITKIADCAYDENATCPRWDAFLEEIMAGNDALIGFLRRAAGYSLTADTSAQTLLFLYGAGANGKSVFLRTLQTLLGPYSSQADSELLLARRGEAHPTGVADLHGARLVVAQETEAGRKLAESLVKQLTGGDLMKARFMRRDFFTFQPVAKIWLASNHRPAVGGTDYAIWRRIATVPFEVTFPPERQDKELIHKLCAELPGILNWALRGCLEWQRDGLSPPDEVRAATERYREEQDPLADFITERCSLDARAVTASAELFKAYEDWAEVSGERYPLGRRKFGVLLSERGLCRERDPSTRRWRWAGIELRDERAEPLRTQDPVSSYSPAREDLTRGSVRLGTRPESDPQWEA